MLMEAEREVRAKGNQYLFSLVPSAPINYYSSMKFHLKNGFEKLAESRPHTIFGMEGYQSILLGKRLK